MEIPSRIGKYKILKKLGEGASGCVVKAEQDIIHRIVALKILFTDLLKQKPLIIKRFQREARLASALIHPSIVPIFEIGEHNGMHFYTMQYIRGVPMTQYVKKNILDFREKLSIFIELSDALALAHERNIVHRDLKPHNVIVTKEQHPVILDFGIAKSLMEEEQMTRVGHILGSAHYMAPEQAGPGNVGTYSDVFALGVMFYELTTTERPFQGRNVKELILNRINYVKEPEKYRPKPMKELEPKIPDFLDKIVFKCLEANPCDRYQTAGELLAELKTFQMQLFLEQALETYQQKAEMPITLDDKKSSFYPFLTAIAIFIFMFLFAGWVNLNKQGYLTPLRKIQQQGSHWLDQTWQNFYKKLK